jgi:ankyrin repeat protein
MITKLWLAAVLVLVLLPSLAIAEATATLNEQLIAAAERGDSALVKSLVNKGADLHAKDADGHTILMSAASGGNLELVKYLIDQGADVNAKDDHGATALRWANMFMNPNSAEIVRYLQSHGAK